MMIRQMAIDDYLEVYDLWSNTPGIGMNAIDDSKAGIAKFLARNPGFCFVAQEKGQIIGVIMAGHDGRRGFIYHLAVKKDRQREGIGKQLLSNAVNVLRDAGIIKVSLVSKSDNEIGNAFWEKQGYTKRPDLIFRNRFIHGN